MTPWQTARTAAQLFAHAPFGTGLHLRAGHGPVRDRFLLMLRSALPDAPFRRCPAAITEDRLLGGLDLGASLAAGRAVAGRGLLAEADGGVVLLTLTDRLTAGTAAQLASVLDSAEVAAERDGFSLRHRARIGLVLLDDGDGPAPAGLLDRLAFRVDLDGIPDADAQDAAGWPAARTEVSMPPHLIETLCEAADTLGIASPRAVLLAVRAARAAAARDGRTTATQADAALAAALVLAHRATRLPSPEQQPEPEPETADAAAEQEAEAQAGATTDTVLAAAVAALPPDLLASLNAAPAAGVVTGRTPGRAADAARGRPAGSRAGRPDGSARLDLIATLRAAAPWQRLRRPAGQSRLAIRPDDLRLRRYQAKPRTTVVFVVDASGSAALNRLAEAKGAVESLLADCYVRRDQVALLAFRGTAAELLLPPTRALARARRCLGGLPGGGGTPLATGLDAAATLAAGLQRRGESPLLVVLTDGRANIARDGAADRRLAGSDALASAARLRALGVPSMLIDISPRPQPAANAVAAAMGARCIAMPFADAAALSRVVRAAA